MRSALLLFAALAAAQAAPSAVAQPFDPGPGFIVPGSSMAGARIDGAPPTRSGPRIKDADIFGDTAAERYYGRDFDDSYLTPRVPRPAPGDSSAAVATQGRADLNTINAGEFATQGPNAIGASSVTRGAAFSRGGRARIVPNR